MTLFCSKMFSKIVCCHAINKTENMCKCFIAYKTIFTLAMFFCGYASRILIFFSFCGARVLDQILDT